jgi:hypothetical protein
LHLLFPGAARDFRQVRFHRHDAQISFRFPGAGNNVQLFAFRQRPKALSVVIE